MEEYLHTLGYDRPTIGQDINSTISGVSKHTGDGESTCGSTINFENTAYPVIKKGEYAKQLIEAKAHQAVHTFI